MRTVLFLVWKEYLHVFRDRATLFQVLAIPMVQLVLLSFAATFEIRESAVYLVDLDRSPASRRLASQFDASRYFRIVGSSASAAEAEDALITREAAMVLSIPAGFEEDLVRARAAPVQLVLDAEQGAAAGIVRSYAMRILSGFDAPTGREAGVGAPVDGAGVTGLVASGSGRGDGSLTLTVAPPQPPRIDLRVRGRYNPALDYTDYMVPGILVALVTIIGTLMTAQNIARERELGTLEQLNVTPVTKTQFIAGKLLPFWILGMVELAAGLSLGRFVFDIPMRGSLLLVGAVAAVYLVAALALGLLISTVAETQQQAMFVTFFLLMNYLLLSGLYTPVSSMPEWIQWLAEVNPVKHFVHVMRSVLVRGAGLEAVAREVGVLTAFAVGLLVLAVKRYQKRAG